MAARSLVGVVAVVLGGAGAACDPRSTCLDGECRDLRVCAALPAAPDGPPVVLRRATAADVGGGWHEAAAEGDVILENAHVRVVLDALDAPHLLAPTGGNILDLAAPGAADGVNQIYQIAGILPDDAFHYTSMTLEDDRGPGLAAVVVRGTLDGRPEVRVATRYEIHAGDRGVRVRSELHNGSAEPFAFAVADVAYWGGREPLPFTPLAGQGFVQTEPDLVTLDTWGRFPFVATNSGTTWVSCSRDLLEGVNAESMTAVGEPRRVVAPGERVVFERVILPDGADGRAPRELRRALGRGDATRTLAGTVEDGAGGDVDDVVVVAGTFDGETLHPWATTRVVDGAYALDVPDGVPLVVQLWRFGRPVVTSNVPAAGAPAPFTVRPGTLIDLDVRDAGTAEPRPATVVFVPADAAEAERLQGTQIGALETCAPWLGPPHRASPACNRVLVDGPTRVRVPAGRYLVYASSGPFATLARHELVAVDGATIPLSFTLRDLPAIAPGLLSTDLHVHGRRSFDSSIPDEDRVRSFAAAGLEVLAATDHDVAGDYGDTVDALGLGGRVAVMAGVETTQLIPVLRVPGDPFPRVIGHFNFFPVTLGPAAPRGGAPFDEMLEPGALFDAIAPMQPAWGVRMLNHPWDEPMLGRDLGYLRAVGFDPRRPIPPEDDGTPQGMLARRSPAGTGNMDVHVVEVLNGKWIAKNMQYRQIWFALLDQGLVVAGAANSDSHGLTEVQVGWPRNLVATATTPADFDEPLLCTAIKAGHMQGGYGIVIDATIDGVPFGLTPLAPADDAVLHVEVRAAPWIPVTEARVIVNGDVVRTLPITTVPADPFGTDDLVRLVADVPLAELVPAGGPDAWLLVEAGLPLPLAADLDDDGIIDTTDNDGDGAVDQRDVEPGEDSGPLLDPADPPPWSDDPRVHVTIVAPGTWPTAFTNPWLIDHDGDGTWVPPGVR